MDDGDETTTLLFCMGNAIAQHERDLSDARDAVFELLVEEAWKVAMRSQHYLKRQCLDKPSESAWMSLYTYGDDLNFLNATSLTRYATITMLCCVFTIRVLTSGNTELRFPSILSGSRISIAPHLQALEAGPQSYNTTSKRSAL
ncbi:hypothetical protein DVH05_017262 [Phytophthora capsici]|nr:hypothetical protein DVH05_017262 [Phytophthora capsici]|eukprot:jgi/Phyca11/105800/e_gw1.11.901.1